MRQKLIQDSEVLDSGASQRCSGVGEGSFCRKCMMCMLKVYWNQIMHHCKGPGVSLALVCHLTCSESKSEFMRMFKI